MLECKTKICILLDPNLPVVIWVTLWKCVCFLIHITQGPYGVTLHNWTPIFGWYMATLASVKCKHQKGMYHN